MIVQTEEINKKSKEIKVNYRQA